MHYTIKRDYRIFEIREKVEFARSKRITAVEVSLQRILIIRVI